MGLFGKKKREKSGRRTPGDDEKACPNCGTLIHTDAAMCYACGAISK